MLCCWDVRGGSVQAAACILYQGMGSRGLDYPLAKGSLCLMPSVVKCGVCWPTAHAWAPAAASVLFQPTLPTQSFQQVFHSLSLFQVNNSSKRNPWSLCYGCLWLFEDGIFEFSTYLVAFCSELWSWRFCLLVWLSIDERFIKLLSQFWCFWFPSAYPISRFQRHVLLRSLEACCYWTPLFPFIHVLSEKCTQHVLFRLKSRANLRFPSSLSVL